MRFSSHVLLFLALTAVFNVPNSPSQTSGTADLQRILDKTALSRLEYIGEFKNLLAEETKTFQVYDKDGDVKKKRTVASTFIVFPLAKREGSVAEFRNVLSVDGKPVSDSEKRAQQFFEEVGRAESSEKEFDKIVAEGSRFDEGITVNGLTLYQAPILVENLRPYFEFRLIGIESRDGHDVYVVSYKQLRDSPYVVADNKLKPADGKMTFVYDLDISDPKNASPRLTGSLWIDALTYRIRREERILSISREGRTEQVKAVETMLTYADSSFEILTPKHIEFSQYVIEKKDRQPRKDVFVSFDYTNFTKPDVQVKSADIKN